MAEGLLRFIIATYGYGLLISLCLISVCAVGTYVIGALARGSLGNPKTRRDVPKGHWSVTESRFVVRDSSQGSRLFLVREMPRLYDFCMAAIEASA
jgi:hypothetical protein